MRDYIQDQYAPLAHIPELSRTERPIGAPTWIDDHDTRRLTVYRVLAAYRENNRRYWLPESMWVADLRLRGEDFQIGDGQAANYREYGDAGLLIDTARSLLLGEDQTIDYPEGTPKELATWLEEWWAREKVTQKLLEGEENSIGDGDGVYTLGWSTAKERPVLRVYDPGFFFPDPAPVPGWEDDEFPSTVHLAWEWEDADGQAWIRRHTWTMRPLAGTIAAPWGSPRSWTCWYRQVDYKATELLPRVNVYSPELTKQPYRVIRTTGGNADGWVDTAVDFIPVIHVPNDASTQRMFGRSLLLRVAHILDDLGNTDTDMAAASQQAAPPLVTTGVAPGGLEGGPGSQWGLPTGATAGFLDTSHNLDALMKFDTSLLDRLAVNTRLAQALLGRVQPNDVPSGYALQLGFHPARMLLREMRTVRDEKYPLILRFALRLAQVAGKVPAGPTPAVTISLGASLPADLPVAIDTVKALLPAGGLSTLTAVKMLQAAGLNIEDAEEEVARIRGEQFKAAGELYEATGDAAAVREFLGLPPRMPVLPAAVLPPAAAP